MRIIHTADWHSGLVSWRGSKMVRRTEEIREVLNSLVQKSKLLDPDLILVAGDLIHYKRNPSLDSIKVVLDILEDLSKQAPVVVVAGNHDWEGIVTYDRLSSDITIVGHGDYKRRIVDTNSGKVAIYPLPYITGKMMLSEGKEKVLKSLVGYLKKFDMDNPDVDYKLLASHMMFRGIVKPFEDMVSIELEREYIGSSFSYVALGHVHSFQKVISNPPAYYSGSVIQVDFSENEDKGFLVVDIDGWNVDVKFEKLPHKILKTLDLSKERREKIFSKVEEALEDADYMRVVINEKDSDLTGKLLKIDKVVSVKVKEEEDRLMPQIETFEDVNKVFFDYIRSALKSRFPPEKVKIGMEIFQEAFEKSTTDKTMA